jgi:hypothetical protein
MRMMVRRDNPIEPRPLASTATGDGAAGGSVDSLQRTDQQAEDIINQMGYPK